MTWTKDDPAQGSPAAIQGLAQLRSARAAKIRDAQQSLHAAATSSGEEWKAMSQPAFAAKLSADAADVELLATGLEAQASALQTYAGQLSELKDRQRVLEQQRSSAQMDFGLTRLQVAASDSELPPLLRAESPDPDVMSAAKRKAAAARTALEGAEAKMRGIDAQWDQLVADRRTIDSTCVAALQGDQVLGKLAGVTSSTIAGSTPAALMALVAGMSAIDLKILLQQHPELARALDEAAPSDVAQWWGSLPQSAQDALVTGLPAVIGALNGIPALVRVAANKINAQARLAAIDDELARQRKLASDTGSPQRFEEKIAALEDERDYLRLAVGAHPSVQLYLYDQAKDRIVEMEGTPSASTTTVITYVPGTFASMDGFFSGETQKVATYLHQHDKNGTVAFVYKDGTFPQSIGEANDESFGLAAGERLARFEAGLQAQSDLSQAQSVGMGHSWGLANVTSSETAGAHYAKVLSLSGAGAPRAWSKAPGTEYRDFSYDDILQDAQHVWGGHVWEGRNPREIGFAHGDYYPAPSSMQDFPLNGVVPSLQNGMDLHNLIANDSVDNRQALRDMQQFIQSGVK
ncbi:hypothetical protein [Curtobacterium sp. 9128]|uniref:hypothetical protein n=1 Tax=Curtobacterium sp. 9128 TaxID=1793722 RepID=UPI0011A4A45F|nr:hypothetical protein [Curtobacterium sp. 9128]